MATEDGLDVGIVAYGRPDLLRACVASLHEHAPSRPLRVVALIEPRRNLGFAAATNAAIRRTRARYFLALNPDTRLHAGTLDRLLELMDADPRVGICGCRLEREDGTFDHAAKRSFPTPLGALAHFTGVGRRANVPAALAQYRAPDVDRGPVDAVSGAFMLIRRSALDDVGPFDEGYWLYMEDLDLCYRFAQAGWVTWYEPSVVATHVKGGTSGPNRTLRVNHAFHRGMRRFYRQHYAPARSPLFNLGIEAAITVKFAASSARSAYARSLSCSRNWIGRPF